MSLISDNYREQNRFLHETNERYGTSGIDSAKYVVELANATGFRDILDYGCGKGTLRQCLSIPIKEYDPCIIGKNAPPEPAEFIVCTNVLEHIEPECLDDVLDDLQRLTKHILLLVVTTEPASENLPDGRNAHLIVEPAEYWLSKIVSRWELTMFKSLSGAFMTVLEVKQAKQTEPKEDVESELYANQLDTPPKDAGIPFTIMRIENTNSCKYTCEMCPRESMTRLTGIMPPQDFQLFLDRLKEYVEETQLPQPFDSIFSLYGYGEPLFDPTLAIKSAMVAEQFPASESFIYSTLGVRRPKSYFESLLVEGELKNITISLYGFQEDTYKAIHQGGDFHTVVENLMCLATLNKSLGNPCNIKIQLLNPYTLDVLNNNPKEQHAFDELMATLEPLGVTVIGALKLNNFGNGRAYNDPNVNKSICSVVGGERETQLYVTWDLKILPCCFDYNADMIIGDLRKQSIYEIYHSEDYQNFIAAHRAGNLDDYPVCKGCDMR